SDLRINQVMSSLITLQIRMHQNPGKLDILEEASLLSPKVMRATQGCTKGLNGAVGLACSDSFSKLVISPLAHAEICQTIEQSNGCTSTHCLFLYLYLGCDLFPGKRFKNFNQQWSGLNPNLLFGKGSKYY
ncbi:unnamed protein product, partial [Ilex paraguariensis]